MPPSCSYLDHNCIARVEGLHQNRMLEELHVAHQRLPEGTKMTIDRDSLVASSVPAPLSPIPLFLSPS